MCVNFVFVGYFQAQLLAFRSELLDSSSTCSYPLEKRIPRYIQKLHTPFVLVKKTIERAVFFFLAQFDIFVYTNIH